MEEKGLILIHTGEGKGKTTSALGQALRAAGHGMHVCIIQFIKGKWKTGETKIFETLSNLIEIHVMGSGFTWQADDQNEVKNAALEGWKLAKEKIESDTFDLVILDELTYLLSFGIVKEEEVLELLSSRPNRLHILLTGRDASAGLIKAADLVTEMREIKHPFQQSIKARKGIEW